MFLLGVTSCLFFVCTTPVAILSIIFSTETYLDSLPLQIFRAVANILEIVNFAMTFYIYCLFSTEFRQTFLVMVGLRSPSASLGAAPACGGARSLMAPTMTSDRTRRGTSLAPNHVSYPTFLGCSQLASTPSRDTIHAHSSTTTTKTASEPEIGRLLASYNVSPSLLLTPDFNKPANTELKNRSPSSFVEPSISPEIAPACESNSIDVHIIPPTPCNAVREHQHALNLMIGDDDDEVLMTTLSAAGDL
jgi:hypothetical protein